MPFGFSKNDDIFNDCPICLAQMRADKEGRRLTMDEFVTASRAAQKKGALVGTDLP